MAYHCLITSICLLLIIFLSQNTLSGFTATQDPVFGKSIKLNNVDVNKYINWEEVLCEKLGLYMFLFERICDL